MITEKKVLLIGPVLSNSGYGEHARCVLRSLLRNLGEFQIFIHPTNWGATSTDTADTPENRYILDCIRRAHHYKGPYDLSVQVALPNEWQNAAKVNIGVTAAVETDRCNPQWIHACNQVDKVIVVSEHAANSLTSMKYQLQDEHGNPSQILKASGPISVVGYPVKNFEDSNFSENLNIGEFNFLSVAQISPRKNISNMIKWFVEEFYSEEVGLLLKCNLVNDSIMDREKTCGFLRQLIQQIDPQNKRKCKIHVLHGRLSEQDLHSVYQDERVKGYVTTAHGEGFGLPVFEAAYSGLPVVATNWSGYLDFLRAPVTNATSGKITTQSLFLKTKFELKQIEPEAVMKDILIPESQWAYADEKSFKRNLRSLYNSHNKYKKDAKILQDHLVETYSEDNVHNKMLEEIQSVLSVNEDKKDLTVTML